jgi:hypothetical protein
MPERIPQSTTIRVPLQAYLASDHVSAAVSKTIAITISKNGGSYANPSAGATNATGIASGSYYVDLSTTDSGTLGPLFVKGSEATIDDIIVVYNVVKATNGGLTALPDTAVTTNASLLTSGTGTAQLSVSSGLVSMLLTQVLSTARALDAIGDTSLTINDVFHCAVAAATGKEVQSGTSYVVKTPSTGTVLRTFTLDSSTSPTSRT